MGKRSGHSTKPSNQQPNAPEEPQSPPPWGIARAGWDPRLPSTFDVACPPALGWHWLHATDVVPRKLPNVRTAPLCRHVGTVLCRVTSSLE